MKKKVEWCDYCVPEIPTISKYVGSLMTDNELVAVRGGIEALGSVMHCDTEKQNCRVLMYVQGEIERRKREKK